MLFDRTDHELGRLYQADEEILAQGEEEVENLYIILEGQVEVFAQDANGKTVRFSVLGEGEILGELAALDGGPRCASARAMGKARILTIDRRGLLRRIQEDPSLALRLLVQMSRRIRLLDQEVLRLHALGKGQEEGE
ncbi:MAG: cyclic nucleotide-binding domain-containing protein [Magnetococcales bacterium]|nr:cyclic nucleotide-binding domain-containing protein [Magnetococcales bacterium]